MTTKIITYKNQLIKFIILKRKPRIADTVVYNYGNSLYDLTKCSVVKIYYLIDFSNPLKHTRLNKTPF